MKNFILSALAILIVAVGILIVFAFAGWVTSILFNIALKQMGLGLINTWAGMGILAGGTVIKTWINW